MAAPHPETHLPWRDPLVVFAPWAKTPNALLLHDGRHNRARLFVHPDRVMTGTGRADFDALAAIARREGGVWAGLFGYDLAAAFERLPHLDPRWPPLAMARYPAWAEFDRDGGMIRVRGESADAVARLADAINAVPDAASTAAVDARALDWSPRWDRNTYLAAAGKARDYVHAGDVFQVNLSQAFDVWLDPVDTPWQVFARLCEDSPAPHSAYLCLDADHVVLTNSPERFLKVGGRHVEARPIKGTRRRSADPAEDKALAAELLASAKDRAENLMIVDLMRNDLSRVCAPGSVSVPVLCEIESYANVHHLVSVVEGDLADGRDGFDLLAASFPPGSITGAPKVRAMEIISELESEPRGAYCGALGWIDMERGDMDLNVMIRTAALRRDGGQWRASLRSGGGIVADSEPVAEYEETLTKVSALRQALGAGSA
ncbi:anthranilate synthase component I family protein [Maricaulis sp. W15]|uniref:anthranilate synthase component I family protein n=1 Tax=Maricaulis sp. W15 TaxID=1772333 RepID=UPI000948C955|nr:anthranilate synthase component I family protein [Maricaulis sp. W15]